MAIGDIVKHSRLRRKSLKLYARDSCRHVWDLKFGPGSTWDDSIVVANLFPAKKGSRTKVPTNESYEKWDCTALFQATIQPQTFALPDSKGNLKTLSELYVKARRFMPHGSFHTSVSSVFYSPVGNEVESFAFAIDRMRLSRNSFCHSNNSTMDRKPLSGTLNSLKTRSKLLESSDRLD